MTGRAQILVVDDDASGRALLRRLLEMEGHAVREAVDGLDAMEQLRSQAPDLVLLDVLMPRMNGHAVCQAMKTDPRTRLIPVVMLSSLDQLPERLKARDLDADDYLLKPYSPSELQARVRSLLRLKRHLDELENAAAVLHAMAAIVDERDAYVSDHCREVAFLCAGIGAQLGLDDEALARLRLGATFHDIGKIAIADALLHKPGPLDEAERARMKEHPVIGASLIAPMRSLAEAVPLIRHHHERLDGSGYPDGLSGEQISLEVRILSVVDIFQALISERPYKSSMPAEKAIAILREEAAKGWWDARIVDTLASLVVKAVA